MIGNIRRKFTGLASVDLWDVNQELQPELDQVPESGYLAVDPALGVATGYGPAAAGMKDYCLNVVQTAITKQGWYGGMRISVPWLRMTLAGLESRHVPAEMMWEGAQEPGPDERRNPGVPSYDSVFESERALVQKLGLK